MVDIGLEETLLFCWVFEVNLQVLFNRLLDGGKLVHVLLRRVDFMQLNVLSALESGCFAVFIEFLGDFFHEKELTQKLVFIRLF